MKNIDNFNWDLKKFIIFKDAKFIPNNDNGNILNVSNKANLKLTNNIFKLFKLIWIL